MNIVHNAKIAETMRAICTQLTVAPLVLKKTNYIYGEQSEFLIIERVRSYYMEHNRKFTWLKQWKENIFIYGDPFGHYYF